jgi:hypothetical protein
MPHKAHHAPLVGFSSLGRQAVSMRCTSPRATLTSRPKPPKATLIVPGPQYDQAEAVGKQVLSHRPSSPTWILPSPRKLDELPTSIGVGPTSALDGVLLLDSLPLPDPRRGGPLPRNPSPRSNPMAALGLRHADAMGPGVCREDSVFSKAHSYAAPRSPRATFGSPRASSSRNAQRFKVDVGDCSPGPAYGAVSSFTSNVQVGRAACISPSNGSRPRSAATARPRSALRTQGSTPTRSRSSSPRRRPASPSRPRSNLFDQGRPSSPAYSLGGSRPVAQGGRNRRVQQREDEVMFIYMQARR